MEPMNTFLSSHRNEFKGFVDTICSISSINDSAASPIPPSYSTPLAILTRLPPTSREGFPSLPYLVDHAKNFATLVNLWLDHGNNLNQITEEDGELLAFHRTCVNLRQRTEDCLAQAERAERPGSTLSFRWEELVEGLEAAAPHPAHARSLHSRVGSSSASTTKSAPDSPIEVSRNHSRVEMPLTEDVIPRTKSRTARRQNSHSSAISSAPSPYPGSEARDEVQYDSTTPPRSSHDDAVQDPYMKPGTRGIYPISAGSLSSQDTSRTMDRNTSRDLPVTQPPKREHTRTPAHGKPSSSSKAVREHHNHSSSSGEERSWLGDLTHDPRREEQHEEPHEVEEQTPVAWTSERERAWKSDGEGLVRTPTSNGRPTRNANKRHAVVQQRAEEMEPGEPKDWNTRSLRSNGGSSVERLPRRDWAVPTDERQRRLVIDMAAERAAAMRAGSLVSSPTALEPIGNPLDGGFSTRNQGGQLPVQQGNFTYPPGSSHSSYPNSRRQSRQGSITSGHDGSDGEPTALPKMQYKNAASALAAEIGVMEGYGGSSEGKKERQGSVFDRIGFKKKKER